MQRFVRQAVILAVGSLSLCAAADCRAQKAVNSDAPVGEVAEAKISPPIYPPLALQTRIAGDVELTLDIRSNGSVASATVVSGHPLLRQAALDSARQTQFECRNCDEQVHPYRMVYSFQLGPTKYCTNTDDKTREVSSQTYPQLIEMQDHVTLVAQPVGTCDLAGKIDKYKVRSAKCLYLWRCAAPKLLIYE